MNDYESFLNAILNNYWAFLNAKDVFLNNKKINYFLNDYECFVNAILINYWAFLKLHWPHGLGVCYCERRSLEVNGMKIRWIHKDWLFTNEVKIVMFWEKFTKDPVAESNTPSGKRNLIVLTTYDRKCWWFHL